MASSAFEKFSEWLELKIYQTELTFAVYIYTPWEKFIFWSITLLLLSLTFIATVFYLPQQIIFIITRAWFYLNGEDIEATKEAVGTLVYDHGSVRSSGAMAAVKETMTGIVREL